MPLIINIMQSTTTKQTKQDKKESTRLSRSFTCKCSISKQYSVPCFAKRKRVEYIKGKNEEQEHRTEKAKPNILLSLQCAVKKVKRKVRERERQNYIFYLLWFTQIADQSLCIKTLNYYSTLLNNKSQLHIECAVPFWCSLPILIEVALKFSLQHHHARHHHQHLLFGWVPTFSCMNWIYLNWPQVDARLNAGTFVLIAIFNVDNIWQRCKPWQAKQA